MKIAHQLLNLPLFSAWMRMPVLALAGMIILCGAPGAFALGLHHQHSGGHLAGVMASAAQTAETRDAQVASIEALAVAAVWPVGCDHRGHSAHHGNGACCGTACCAAALACNVCAGPTPNLNADIPRLLARSLVLIDVSFGLDRPPDFRG